MPTTASSPEVSRRLRRELVPVPRMVRAGVAFLAVVLAAALLSAVPASAHWQASGTGMTTAAVGTLLPPTNTSVPARSAETWP